MTLLRENERKKHRPSQNVTGTIRRSAGEAETWSERKSRVWYHRRQEKEEVESSVELNAPFRTHSKEQIKDEHKDMPTRLFQYCL